MKSGRLRNMVLLIIGASIIKLFCSSMVVATITWLDNLVAVGTTFTSLSSFSFHDKRRPIIRIVEPSHGFSLC